MRMEDGFYKVASQSRDMRYDVTLVSTGWKCSCLDYYYRTMRYKHIIAVEISQRLRDKVRKNVLLNASRSIMGMDLISMLNLTVTETVYFEPAV